MFFAAIRVILEVRPFETVLMVVTELKDFFYFKGGRVYWWIEDFLDSIKYATGID